MLNWKTVNRNVMKKFSIGSHFESYECQAAIPLLRKGQKPNVPRKSETFCFHWNARASVYKNVAFLEVIPVTFTQVNTTYNFDQIMQLIDIWNCHGGRNKQPFQPSNNYQLWLFA